MLFFFFPTSYFLGNAPSIFLGKLMIKTSTSSLYVCKKFPFCIFQEILFVCYSRNILSSWLFWNPLSPFCICKESSFHKCFFSSSNSDWKQCFEASKINNSLNFVGILNDKQNSFFACSHLLFCNMRQYLSICTLTYSLSTTPYSPNKRFPSHSPSRPII